MLSHRRALISLRQYTAVVLAATGNPHYQPHHKQHHHLLSNHDNNKITSTTTTRLFSTSEPTDDLTTTIPAMIRFPKKKNKKKKTYARAKVKTKSGNVRGSRGHGWLYHYRNEGGGRHLHGEYADGRRAPVEELQEWNRSILNLGMVTAYFDVTVGENQLFGSNNNEDMEAAATTTSNTVELNKEGQQKQHVEPDGDEVAKTVSEATVESPTTDTQAQSTPTEPSNVTRHRLYMDIATKAMPVTTRNFLELCQQSTMGYTNSIIHRLDKRIGILGGDVVAHTGHAGRCAASFLESSGDSNAATAPPNASSSSKNNTISGTFLFNSDHYVMTHIGGTISMLCSKVKTVDSRFIIITQPDAPHLDGYHLAFGQLHPESLTLVQSWLNSIFTKRGHPLADLRIVECGVIDKDNKNDVDQATEEEKEAKKVQDATI